MDDQDGIHSPAERPSLRTRLAGVELESPLVLASGILGVTASLLARVARHGIGAVTTKSFSLEERPGHKSPTIVAFDHGFLNAVGLSNPGWEAATETIREYRTRSKVPIIASVFGKTVEEYPLIAEKAAAAGPDLLEVNVSCPNVAAEFGAPFEADPKVLATVTESVKRVAGKVPVAMKLSANFGAIGRMAKVCEDHGADAITAINTVGPGMLIDLNVKRPVLANKVGGVSGPCILPIAVRSVWEIRKAVKIPIIGTGGVGSAEDALQMILAGATAVGIGSALAFDGLESLPQINAGLERYLAGQGLSSLDAIRGAAHEP
ncbi:MAG: dihydroorotate dehydrogenase [Deltaproteobacteria bacterium]|nr:dihydroorotate dehydrogenase [Deltaproteobacteria bacterium]